MLADENYDEPPPLEDLSHLLSHRQNCQQIDTNLKVRQTFTECPVLPNVSKEPIVKKQSGELLNVGKSTAQNPLLINSPDEGNPQKPIHKIEEIKPAVAKSKSKGSFGFAKGFLSSGTGETRGKHIYVDETSRAPKNADATTNETKYNPEIEKILAEQLGEGWEKDKEFYDAIQLFSVSPEEALKKYGDNQKVVQCLVSVASKLMPQAFPTQIQSKASPSASSKIEELVIPSASGQMKKSNEIRLSDEIPVDELSKRVEIPNDLPEHEKDLIKRVMSDPIAQEAMRDPEVQKYISDIQRNLMLQTVPPPVHLREKIQRLVQIGLLQFK